MLPAFTFASVSRWSCAASLQEALRREVNGRVIPISPRLAREETEALVDLLESTAGMTVEVTTGREGMTASPDRVFLWESATGETPAGVDASVVLYPEDELHPRRFDLPPVMRALTHALAHHVGVEFQRDAKRESLGRWLMEFADTPGTAKAFLQGALRVAAKTARPDEHAQVAAGTASVMDWLLRPLRSDVREHLLALVLRSRARPPREGDLLANEGRFFAELLGAGLVEHLPERDDPALDLRTPLRSLYPWLRSAWEPRFPLWRRELLALAPSLSSSLKEFREGRERLAQLGPVTTTVAWWPQEVIETTHRMLNETSEVLLGAVELSQGEGRQEFAAQVAELVGRTRPCIALDLGEMGESVYWVDVATRRSGTWVGSEWTAPLLARGTLSDFASSPYVFIADNADSLSDTDLLGLTRAVHKAGSSAFLLLVDRLRSAPLRRYLSFVLSPRSGLGGALQTLPFAERFHDLWGTFTDRIGDLRVATRLHARLPPERLATILGSSDPPPSNALFDAALETLTPEEWRVVDVLFTGPSPGTHRDIVQLLAPCSQESMDWMRDVGLLGEHQGRLRLASAWRARPAMDRFNAPSIDLRSFWERSVAVLRFILEQPPAECREGALWIEAVSLRRALCDAHRRQAPPAAISTVELAAMTLLAFTLDLDDLPEQSWLKHPISGFHARFARVFRSEERLRRGWVSIETALGDRAVLPQLRAELVAQIGDLLPEPGMKPPG